MKFIHTADIHWGMIPDSDKPWGKKREQAIRLTFRALSRTPGIPARTFF